VNPNAVPVFLPVKPIEGGERLDCYANVSKQVQQAGGKVEYGWIIWLDPGFLIEAEHHSVWVSPDGEWVDVSPHKENQVLFLPGAQPFQDRIIPNLRRGLLNDPKMARWLAILDRLDQLRQQHELPGGRMVITGEMSMLQMQALQLQTEMGKAPSLAEVMEERPSPSIEFLPTPGGNFRGVGRNDKCPCRSGKKFKKCCMKRV
jgi:hypothetical protein